MALVCRVELDKTKGLILTVENAEGKITQTVVMNGTSITTTNKGDKDTSTITQTPDTITVKCKNYKLEAETIVCESTKTTLHKSSDKFDIQSVKDMTLKTDAKLSQTATADAVINCKNLTATASENAKITGKNFTGEASASQGAAKITGKDVAISGKASAKMDGAGVEVSAKGKMDVKGKMTTLDGKMTTIKGTSIKIG